MLCLHAQRCRKDVCAHRGLQLPSSPQDGTHTLTGNPPSSTINHLLETDKFLSQGGEKLSISGFQAWLGEWVGQKRGGEKWGLVVNTFDDYIEIPLPSVHSSSQRPAQANQEQAGRPHLSLPAWPAGSLSTFVVPREACSCWPHTRSWSS